MSENASTAIKDNPGDAVMATVWRRFRWRLAHPDHPRYHGSTITTHLTGMRCRLPTGHEGYCENGSRTFSWENKW